MAGDNGHFMVWPYCVFLREDSAQSPGSPLETWPSVDGCPATAGSSLLAQCGQVLCAGQVHDLVQWLGAPARPTFPTGKTSSCTALKNSALPVAHPRPY